MSENAWNLVVWVGWFITLGFLTPEIPAAFKTRLPFKVPWDTFSRFVWDAQARWEFLTVPVVAVVAILASHLIRLIGVQEGDRQALKAEVRARKAAKALKVLQETAPGVLHPALQPKEV